MAWAAVATMLVAAAAAVALGQPFTGASPRREQPIARRGASQAVGVLTRQLAVLRRARGALDRLPRDRATRRLLRGVPLDPRRVRLVAAVPPTWIAVTADGREACVLSRTSLGCGGVRDLLRRGASPAVFWRAGAATIAGIAIDAVKRIEVRYGDRTVALDVVGNFFRMQAAGVPLALHWRGPSGPETLRLPPELQSRRIAPASG